MLSQENQEILKTSKNNHNSWKALHLLCTLLTRICEWRSVSRFIFVCTLFIIIPTNLHILTYSPCDRGQIGIKLGQNMLYTKYWQILCRKSISMLTGLKLSSLAYKCVFYRPEHNAKGDP